MSESKEIVFKDKSINTSQKNFLNEIQNHGKKVYKTKQNMKELIDIMENPQFKDFFDKHFNNWDDIHTVTILMLSIKYIDDYNDIYNTSNKNLNKFQKIGLLDNILSDSKQRKLLFQHFTHKLNLEFDNKSDSVPRIVPDLSGGDPSRDELSGDCVPLNESVFDGRIARGDLQ